MPVHEQRVSKIPAFASFKGEVEFWDTHDLGEVEGELEPIEVEVSTSIGHVLSVELDSVEFRRVLAAGRQHGVTASALARTWVLEGLERAAAAEAKEPEHRVAAG